MDLEDFGVEFDDDGRLVGFQGARATALLEWRHRKEASEFKRLCAKLFRVQRYRANHSEEIAQARARVAKAKAENAEAFALYCRIVQRKHYAQYKAIGMCISCGKKAAKVRCAACAKVQCDAAARRREKARSVGLCVICANRKATGGAVRCMPCQIKRRSSDRQRRSNIRAMRERAGKGDDT